MSKWVHIVVYIDNAIICCECFNSRKDAQEYAKILRDQGKDPWHETKPIRTDEFINYQRG